MLVQDFTARKACDTGDSSHGTGVGLDIGRGLVRWYKTSNSLEPVNSKARECSEVPSARWPVYARHRTITNIASRILSFRNAQILERQLTQCSLILKERYVLRVARSWQIPISYSDSSNDQVCGIDWICPTLRNRRPLHQYEGSPAVLRNHMTIFGLTRKRLTTQFTCRRRSRLLDPA